MATTIPAPVKKQHSYILPLAIFLFGIVLCIAIVFQVLIYMKNTEGAKLDTDVTNSQAEIDALLTPEIKAYMQAKKISDSGVGNRAAFSDVLSKLIEVLRPLNVLVSSLSIDNQNKLTINLIAPDYDAVTKTISTVKKENLFVSVFVPNISSGVAADRSTVVNFPLVIDLTLSKAPVSASPSPSVSPTPLGIAVPKASPIGNIASTKPLPTISTIPSPSPAFIPTTNSSPAPTSSPEVDIPNL